MRKSGLVHVVDDNADIRRMLALVLESQGYTVRVHDGGAAYLAAAPSEAPHVMLLDVRMPGMSGLELHAKLKESGHDIPVIFMSGESQAHETQTANSLGATTAGNSATVASSGCLPLRNIEAFRSEALIHIKSIWSWNKRSAQAFTVQRVRREYTHHPAAKSDMVTFEGGYGG